MQQRAPEDLMARLMAIFGAEAAQRLDAMRRDVRLLQGGPAPEAVAPLLDRVAREAHTLKGAAGSVGVEPVRAIAGALEELFKRLGEDEPRPAAGVWTAVERALEAARALVGEATAGVPAGVDPIAITATLDAVARSTVAPAPPPPSPPSAAGDVVAVPRAKLEALLGAVGELTAAHAALQQRLAELERAADELHGLLLSEPAPPVDSERPKVVLVVENAATTRTLQKHLLEHAGYEVRLAADGVEGWSALQGGGIDVVVSDILMPGLDGFELTARIRADRRLGHLPVILVTATDAPGRRERSAEIGANAYLVKGSIEPEDLARTIERLA